MNRYCQRNNILPITVAFFALAICTASLLSCQSGAPTKPDYQPKTTESLQNVNLRGVFYGAEGSTQMETPVGRLHFLKLENGSTRKVRFDHPFRSLDKFRITVASNRRGYLYLFHRSPTGKIKLLWPREPSTAKGSPPLQVRVQQEKKYIIPPEPGFFYFDEETGDETFCVVIRKTPWSIPNVEEARLDDEPQPIPPMNFTLQADQNIRVEAQGKGEILVREVLFDPGKNDPDPAVYFSSYPGDDAEDIRAIFKLKHEK